MMTKEKERCCDGENGQYRRRKKKTKEDKDRIYGNYGERFEKKKKMGRSERRKKKEDEDGGETVNEIKKWRTPLKAGV